METVVCCSCVAGNTSVSRRDGIQCDYEHLSAMDCDSYESCTDCVAHSHTQSTHSATSAPVCLCLCCLSQYTVLPVLQYVSVSAVLTAVLTVTLKHKCSKLCSWYMSSNLSSVRITLINWVAVPVLWITSWFLMSVSCDIWNISLCTELYCEELCWYQMSLNVRGLHVAFINTVHTAGIKSSIAACLSVCLSGTMGSLCIGHKNQCSIFYCLWMGCTLLLQFLSAGEMSVVF